MNALLAGLLVLTLGQSSLPKSGGASEVIARTPVVGSPLEGFLLIGEWRFKRGQLEPARQLFAYGLLYAPSDVRFLSWLARTEEGLGHTELAREYAQAALLLGGTSLAREVLARLDRASPRPSQTPFSPSSPAASASQVPSPASPAPSPAHAPSPAPVKISGEVLASLAPLVGVKNPKKLEGLTRGSISLDPKFAGDRLEALGVLKAVDAALKIYKLNHPKATIKELDPKALIDDKALPRDLDLSIYPSLSLDGDGKLSMGGFGMLDALEGELAKYREGLDKAVRERDRGLLAEAHATLKELAKAHLNDPTLLTRLLALQMELSLDFEAIKTAQGLFLTRPSEPRHLYTLALLYFRTSRPDRARQIATLYGQIYPATFYATAAHALVRLIDAGVTPALLQALLASKEAELGREASPAPSPKPSARPTAATVSPSPAH